MRPASWIVRFDGTPTTGARIAAVALLLCGFLGGFAARSRGEEAKPRQAAKVDVQGMIASDAPATAAAAPRLRLAPAAALPGLRAAPQRRRARRPVATPVPVAEPEPSATPTPDPTPEPTPVAPVPVAAPPGPQAVPAPPRPSPAVPDVSFDSSG